MMHQFNKTIDYLESTLTSEVELKKFQNISGYSYPLFSRIFSILSEITLAEYLRNRKLTLAVDDLLNTDQKVIDIALKYNYLIQKRSIQLTVIICTKIIGFPISLSDKLLCER